MRYALLAVERLVAAVFVLPVYAAKPTRRERVSRRGPIACNGERATLAGLDAGGHSDYIASPSRRKNRSGQMQARGAAPSGAHPRGLPGHGKPSTASRAAAHSPASERPLDLHSAAAWQGFGGAQPPKEAPAHASPARRERALPARAVPATDGSSLW